MDPWTAFALGLAVGLVLTLVVGAILWHLLTPDVQQMFADTYRLELRAEAWRQIAMVYRDELPDMPDMFSRKVPDIRRVK